MLHGKDLTLDLKKWQCKNEKLANSTILLPAPNSLQPQNRSTGQEYLQTNIRITAKSFESK